MSTVRKFARGASTRIVTYPVRVLIIINSVLFPLLLGVIIFLILHYSKPVMDVITKAKSIEKLVEDNIHIGITKVKELYTLGKTEVVDYATISLVNMLNLPDNIKNNDEFDYFNALKMIVVNAFDNNISHDFNTESILDFVKDHDMVNNTLDDIIEVINGYSDFDTTKKEIIINAINEIKSHKYTNTQFITHYELMGHTNN